MRTPSPFPSKANARPTLPGAKVEFPPGVPLAPDIASRKSFSARHQAAKPAGGGTQGTTGVTETLSSSKSTPTVAEDVSVKVMVEASALAVKVNVFTVP